MASIYQVTCMNLIEEKIVVFYFYIHRYHKILRVNLCTLKLYQNAEWGFIKTTELKTTVFRIFVCLPLCLDAVFS